MLAGATVEDTQGIPQGLPLFDGIPREKIGTVLKCLNAYPVDYERGDTIVRREQHLRFAGYLIQGEALSIRYDFWGNRSIIGEYPTGSVIAGSVLFDETESIPLSIVAKSDCRVLNFNIDKEIRGCAHCMKYASIIQNNAAHALIDMNSRLTRRLDVLSNRSTRDKLLSYFTEQAEANGSNRFSIPYNRQELADYLYIERSSLSRELGNMQKEGFVVFRRNNFELLRAN